MGDEGVVNLLLEREDIDPNRTNKHGDTPLSVALSLREERVVNLLLQRGRYRP